MEIVGLGKACEIAKRDLAKNADILQRTRDRLENSLIEVFKDDVRINAGAARRLPNTLSISFHGLEANRILEEIGLSVAASAGAACHSDHVSISHVLEAMKVPEAWAKGTLRFTTGRMTTVDEIDEAVRVISAAVQLLAKAIGLG